MPEMEIHSPDDIRLANTRTVDALQRVYAMVIALALTTAVKLLVETLGIVARTSPSQADRVTTILLFVAFLSTLVAFYHGMNRHLDDTFVIGGGAIPRRLPLLIDIFVFLVEGALLAVMASTITVPFAFLCSWSVLLAVDIVWGLYVYLVVKRTAPAKWVGNNSAFLICAWVSWLFIFPASGALIAVIETLRSGIDYRLNWAFYFPRRDS